MRRPFRNVADSSRSQRDAFAVDAQPSAALDDVANDVFVVVVDLFSDGALVWAESDQSAREMLFFEAVGVANFFIDFLETLQRRVYLDDLHSGLGMRRE